MNSEQWGFIRADLAIRSDLAWERKISFGDCFVRPGGLATTVGEKETWVLIRAYSAMNEL